MGSKFFNVAFSSRSARSDFSCTDGELEKAEGVKLINGNGVCFNEELSDYTYKTPPPKPEIKFGMVRDILPGWHIVADAYPSKRLPATDTTLENRGIQAERLLRQFTSEARIQNLFVNPFYALGVWKTYNGIYLSPSEPELMIPNSEVPVVATSSEIQNTEMDFRIVGAVCSLYYRMNAPELLRDYIGEIKSLEIMMSQKLQNYDPESMVAMRNVGTLSWCRSLDIVSGKINDERICTETLPLAWKANVRGYSLARLRKINLSGLKFYPVATVPLGEVDIKDNWSPVSPDTSSTSGVTYKNLQQESSEVSSGEIIIKGVGMEIYIETRPIKLTGAGNFKIMRRIYLRGSYNRERIKLTVYGSRDMQTWWKISESRGNGVAVLYPGLLRFYKLKANGKLEEGETLEGFTIQN